MFKKIIIYSIVFVFTFVSNGFSLCIDNAKANLRSGAGTNHGITWKVFKYMPLKKVSSKKVKKKTWYQVKDIDGDIHWISASSVTTKYMCGVVKKDNVKVKIKPASSSQNALISPAQKYYSFKVITKKKKWVKVADVNNNYGWIPKNLLWIQ